MSRLEELIKEHCPDGVTYKKIKDVYKRLKGTPITAGKMKEIEDSDGDIRVFAGGKTVINARKQDIPNANITKVPAVLVQSRGVIDFVFYDRPFTFKNEMWAYTAEEKDSVKYLYYVLKNNTDHFREAASGMGSLPQISLPVTEEFIIPVPPMEVQREIVRILDIFTEQTEKLKAELASELTARKKQYEYYREKVLDDVKSFSEMITIGDLGKWSGGKTPSMDRRDFWENGTIPWISSKDMKESTLTDTEDYITPIAVDEASMRVYPKNCIAVVTRSGILKHTFPVAYVPFEATVNQDIKMLIPGNGVIPRFAFHILNAYGERIRICTKKQGGTVDSLNFEEVLDYKIPLPNVETQGKIVEVLDNFDAICSDLNIGLPAEIEARKLQYEYYRDLLLSFGSQFVHVEREREVTRARKPD